MANSYDTIKYNLWSNYFNTKEFIRIVWAIVFGFIAIVGPENDYR